DYDGQAAEALAMVRALNKMTNTGMPDLRTGFTSIKG
ncbi:hypothetical protein WDT14_27160, partial [Klebsiella pneumoniae]